MFIKKTCLNTMLQTILKDIQNLLNLQEWFLSKAYADWTIFYLDTILSGEIQINWNKQEKTDSSC